MPYRIHFAFLILLLVCTVAYWSGLGGGFWFDDYGGLVINEGVRMSQFGWSELSRGTWSYAQSGPLGRPLAMAMFTLDYWVHGLDAWWAKLENLIIHLINGGLIFVLSRRLLDFGLSVKTRADNNVGNSHYLALFITAWWLLNPMAMTSVLYVIQRMTSLAATFSLLGLIGYMHWRIRGRETGRPIFIVLAIACLGMATSASAYTKESGLLTIAYAWVIEACLFSINRDRSRIEQTLRLLCWLVPVFVAAYSFYFVLINPEWLFTQTPGRDFSPWQRLLTEFRILVQYMRQIIFPDSSWFALYHDDISLSLGWLDPLETLWSGGGHLVLIGVSAVTVKRYPLFAFGVIWFYVGHLLESTVFPLELAHEHRNYLPMFGLLVATTVIFQSLGKRLAIGMKFPALLLLAAITGVTAVRADIMGDTRGFYLHQAHNHPKSSRSNYDAAMILIKEVRAERLAFGDAAPRIQHFLDLSQQADVNALPPLLGQLNLASMRNQPAEAAIEELERRLRHGVPPAAIHIIVVGLMELVKPSGPTLTIGDMERLLQAALDNSSLGGVGRSSVHANYGMLLAGMKHDFAGARAQLAEALRVTPNALEVRLNYAGVLLELGDVSAAREQLNLVKKGDIHAYHAQSIQGLEKVIQERLHGRKP